MSTDPKAVSKKPEETAPVKEEIKKDDPSKKVDTSKDASSKDGKSSAKDEKSMSKSDAKNDKTSKVDTSST